MGSPADDALDRLDESIEVWVCDVETRNSSLDDAATVRDHIRQQDEENQRLREERDAYRIEGDHGHDDYEDAEDIIRQIAEKRPNQSFDPWASGLCQEFLDRPRRSRATIATIRNRAEAAEAKNEKLSALIMEQEAEYRKEKRAAEAEVRRLRLEIDETGKCIQLCSPENEALLNQLADFNPDGGIGGLASYIQRLREERDALRESGQRWAENVRGKEAEQVRLTKGLRETADELASRRGMIDRTVAAEKFRALLAGSPEGT